MRTVPPSTSSRGTVAVPETELTSTGGLHVPALRYTTDNAAMIAAAGFLHLERNHLAPPDLNADTTLKL